MLNSNKTLIYLFIAGIFFIPFSSGFKLDFLGEFRNDANAVFLFFGVLLLGISSFKNSLRFPISNLTYRIFIFFICFLFIGILINLPGVVTNFFKQTSGFNRFIRQLVSLLLSSVLFFTFYYNIISYVGKQKILALIRNLFLASLVVVSLYSFIEILIVQVGLNQLRPVIELFDYLPFVDVRLDNNNRRLSSITYEPPALAMFLITIAGWMFSYILTAKGLRKYIPTFLVLSLAVLSGSRTSLVVILFQFLVFLGYMFFLTKHHKLVLRIVKISIFSILILCVVNFKAMQGIIEKKATSLNFTNVKDNYSNQSRFGMQYASLLVFTENPIFGVGFGQQAFHTRHRYPYWAVRENWEFDQIYLNQKVKSFPPGYNIYTRILAETGIVGLALFLSFLFSFFYQAKVLYRKSESRIMGIIIIVSMSGFAFNWFQIDSFRMYGVWLCLALLCFFYNNQKKENANAV